MGEMVVGIPARLEKIEREVGFSRRNSTGSLGIQIAKSKVLSRYLSDPKGSCHEACKGVERDLQTTKARTSLLRRSTIAASEKTQELATTVKLQIRKKPPRSSKLAVNFKRHTTGKAQRQENPAYTKRLAVSVNQQNDLKMKPLQENAYSMSRSYKLRRRGYSDIIIPGGSPLARDSPLDGATSTPNKGSRMDKNTGSSKLSNKKAVGKPANLEKIENEVGYLRRNSTGNLGNEMGDSKVLSRHVSVPTSSWLDASKDGVECNFKTIARTHMSTRSLTSGENSKLATTMKWQIWRTTKLPANLRRLTTSHEEEMQACTKTLAVSASHQRDSKLQPLEENAYSVSSNKSRRRYSDVIITGGSAILQGSLLDDATSKPNTGSKMDKDTGSYEFSKKKDVGVPPNLDKIETEVSYLRRNSTGSLGIEIGESKILPYLLSVPTGSRQEVCKYAEESDLKTRTRTLQPTRPVTTSGEVPEMATTVMLQIGKKPLSSSKLPKFKSRTTFRAQGQEIPASTTISHSTRFSVKRVSGKKPNNDSPRIVSQRNKRTSLPSKTDKVSHEDDPNKVSQLNNLTSLARMKIEQPSNENFPNKTSQLRKWANLKRGKMEQGSHGSVPNETLHIRESKTKSQTIKLSQETRMARVSSFDRHGPERGKRPSPLLSPSSSLHSDGSITRNLGNRKSSLHGPKRGKRPSSLLSPSPSLHSDGSSCRNLGNRKSSLSSISACESFDGDATVSNSRKSGTTSQSQDIKVARTAICSPKNLKFRRGKIIDFQSEKVSPRRLKFRPVKILDYNENGNAYARGRSSRRLIANGKSNAAKDENMKVNLRHQARGNKREAPILFNNVIEETATKLVETRRSKVKALVGAFETIISLQDQRSSPPIIWR
uniref:Uncharacterized protein LOC104239076 n=1 Tax=Nicotiana sylvestris TaxID=4096 RepID=A0A1U7XQL0_NICSY|nr:PREDICTED: uncharacterized protein LOC104239076 [Nicotiana sylvestris]XP_009791907.1 PREDICTED: uncharacterized protein LOC104239076 [Nicotiana sylvestris]XP_009791909.1 PREDICTED: uncharacterized protein LOC104239076 [Nicotiana sylvestris]XP_009791910.1 PREDICTED: uncharacterized protein LOC104239076 [Nicotiana sylvestris]